MAIETIISFAISIISTLAAILAWVVKLRWSDEFIRAKDEILKAKEAQISSLENEVRFLREITSPKIHEYFTSVKNELENYLETKDLQLNSAKTELKIKEEQILELQKAWKDQQSNIEWEFESGITITLEGMVKLLESRERDTEGHNQRVTEMAVNLAKALNVPNEQLINIKRGALLHDIGKMNIPEAILLKPGALTEDEMLVYKNHPNFAYDFLIKIDYLIPAIDIPYCHHEKWDGTGYPRGLKGSEIPLAARIFAVIDVWDALKSDRPYRRGWTTEEIIEYLNKEAGKHFDPVIVEAFLKIIKNKE